MDDEPMTVIEQDAEAAVGQDFVGLPVKGHRLILDQDQADWRLIAETLPLRPVSRS
jgi:hypothetical protein